MATNLGGTGPYEVRCFEAYKRFKTELDATRWKEDVEARGACALEHVITEEPEQ